jgi:hypothetical protein
LGERPDVIGGQTHHVTVEEHQHFGLGGRHPHGHRLPLAGFLMADHHRSGPTGDQAGSVAAAAVDHDHLVDHGPGGRHHLVDRAFFVASRNDRGDLHEG